MHGLGGGRGIQHVAAFEWHAGAKMWAYPVLPEAVYRCSVACRQLQCPAPPAGAPRGAWATLTDAVSRLEVPLAVRENVAREAVRTLAIGYRFQRDGSAILSMPPGAREVVRAVAATLAEVSAPMTFMAVQVNIGFAATPHVDSGNFGAAWCASHRVLLWRRALD